MWVRGLKLLCRVHILHHHLVAPYVGAWIETTLAEKDVESALVAPYVGAWIETFVSFDDLIFHPVAPYVGAWIETYSHTFWWCYLESHPMWVRGLKLKDPSLVNLLARRTLCGCVD